MNQETADVVQKVTHTVKLIVRQVILATVVLVALLEGYNGRIIGAYMVAALLMAGVDLTDYKDLIPSFGP